MTGKQVLSLWDYDKESSTVKVPTVEIDELNFVVENAKMAAMYLAVNNVSKGVIYKDVRTFDDSQISGTPPGDSAAQRELKWKVNWRNTGTFKAGFFTIPAADTALLDVNNKSQMDKAGAPYIALKAAVEDMWYPDAANTVVVGDVVLVGRNL